MISDTTSSNCNLFLKPVLASLFIFAELIIIIIITIYLIDHPQMGLFRANLVLSGISFFRHLSVLCTAPFHPIISFSPRGGSHGGSLQQPCYCQFVLAFLYLYCLCYFFVDWYSCAKPPDKLNHRGHGVVTEEHW